MALINPTLGKDFTFRPSLFNRGLDSGLNVLGTAGRVLDTPGSILRGLLAGRIDKALGGILDTKKRVSGTELLGGRPDKFSWGGLGVELVADPLNLLTFGSLGTAGKLASRAGKLQDVLKGTEGLDITAQAIARRQAVQKSLADVLSKQGTLGREAGERLAPTLAQQAKLGQRSGLAFDIPFTGINVPLTSGRMGLGALTKANQLIGRVPGLPAVGRGLNTVFNPNYSKDLGRVRTGSEQATRKELRTLFEREPEIQGATQQREILGKINALVKSTGLPEDVIRRQLIDTLEGTKLPKLNPLDPKYPGTIALRQRLFGVHPEVSQYGGELSQLLNKFNTEAIQTGVPDASNLSGALGYYGRSLTPQARKFLAKNKEKFGNDKMFRMLSNPSFTKQRKLFKDAPFNEVNDLLRSRFGVDFDFFDPDIATSIGQRVKEQTLAVNKAKSYPGIMKIYGQDKEKGLKDLAGLFKDTSAVRGKVSSTAFNTGLKSKFNARVLKDAAGNVIKQTDDTDAQRALDLAKELRAKRPDFDARILKETDNPVIQENVKNIIGYMKDVPGESIQDAIDILGLEGDDALISRIVANRVLDALPDFNFKNALYHGTTDKNIDLARLKGQGQGGLTPKQASPNFRSTHLVDKPAVYFSPEKDISARYASDAAERWPGAQEHSKPVIDHLIKAAGIPRNIEQIVKQRITDGLYRLKFTRDKKGALDEALKAVHASKFANPEIEAEIEKHTNKILGQYVAITGNPEILKTTLSKLSLFDKLDPKFADIVKAQDEYGKFKVSKLPADVQKKIIDNPKFEHMQDDLSENQILSHGSSDSNLPFGLFKKSDGTPIEGSIERISKPDKIIRWKSDAGKKEIGQALDEAGFKERFVEKSTYNDIKKFYATVKDPELASGALKFLDNVNAIYRGALTTLFPAYHARNMMSGAFMNVLGGVKDPTLYSIAPGKLLRMSPAEKIKLESMGVLGKGLHEETYRMLTNSQFGKSLGKRNPAFKAYSLGKQAGQSVDNLNRYVMYLDGIKKGLGETEAAERVLKYHFDYSDLTDTEKLGLRRGFLFYTFMRKNIPLMLKSLVENPRLMQAYNRSVGGTNENLKKPDWLGDAFFAGYDQKGNMQRLQLGLPAEDLRRFGTHGEGLQRLGTLLFSMLSPVLTAPAELLFNKNLYYNKPMEGNILQRLADVSPISRFTGTAERALQSPGKEALRFGTSLNVKTFNPKDLQRNITIQELQKALRAKAKAGKAREFSVFSATKSGDPEVKELNSRLNKAFKG